MKQAMNFRLSTRATATLSLLEEKQHCSKTAIIEHSLEFYAQQILSKQNSLMAFVGMLSSKEADALLETINTSKYNKDLKVEL
jgi:hypothetical protein